MKQTRTLIAIFAAALLLVASVALTAMAQDNQEAAPEKMADTAKAMMQKGETAADSMATEGSMQEGSMDEQKTQMEGKKEEMMNKETTPAAKGEEMKKDMTAPAKATETEKKMEGEAKSMTKPEEKSKETAAEPEDPKAPYKNIKFEKGEKPVVVMETSMGTITIELWPDVAPKHCQSFVYLINKGFYDSLTFHRIVPGFVIQGGDPLGNGTGGPGYNVPAEFSNKPHEDGILSMARANDPNSAGSQFFICLGRLTNLDNKYTVFGKVIDGLDVVHKIEKAPTKRERPDTPVYMTKVYMKDSM